MHSPEGRTSARQFHEHSLEDQWQITRTCVTESTAVESCNVVFTVANNTFCWQWTASNRIHCCGLMRCSFTVANNTFCWQWTACVHVYWVTRYNRQINVLFININVTYCSLYTSSWRMTTAKITKTWYYSAAAAFIFAVLLLRVSILMTNIDIANLSVCPWRSGIRWQRLNILW